MRQTVFIAVLLMLKTAFVHGQTNDGIDTLVRTTIEKQKDRPMWFQLRSVGLADIPFVYQYKARKIKFDGDAVKDDQSWREDVVIIDGVAFPTIVETSFGLDPKLQRQKEAQNQKRFAALQRRSEAEKRKAQEARNKRRNERRQFWDEFLRAFRFNQLEHKTHNGRATTVIAFVPDPAYGPRAVVDTEYLRKIQGQIWIDDADREIARIEFEFIRDAGAGFGLAGKVYKGTRYYMELAKQIEDQWLPVRAETELRQRILFFKERETFKVEFGNYRKFTADVKIDIAGPR
jgi:hypothetical protein